MAEYGLAGPQDFASAQQHYQIAVNLQHAEAMYNLALMYAYGRGVGQDYHRAAELFDTAAQQHGHPASMYYLGMMHTHGQGVQLDYNLALRFFKLASLSTHPVAKDAKAIADELQQLMKAAGAEGGQGGALGDTAGTRQVVTDAMSILDVDGIPIPRSNIARDAHGRLAAAVKTAAKRARQVGEAIAFQHSKTSSHANHAK